MKYPIRTMFYHIHHCAGRSLKEHFREAGCRIVKYRGLRQFFRKYKTKEEVLENAFKIRCSLPKANFIEIHEFQMDEKYYKLHWQDMFKYLFVENNFPIYDKITIVRNPKEFLLKTLVRYPEWKEKLDLNNIFKENCEYDYDFGALYALPLVHKYKKSFDMIEPLETGVKTILDYYDIKYSEILNISTHSGDKSKKVDLNKIDEEKVLNDVKGIDKLKILENMYKEIIT